MLNCLRGGNLSKFYKSKVNDFHHMTVVRNNIRMHRVAAELQKLHEIDPNMSETIRDFIKDQKRWIVNTKTRNLVEDISIICDYIHSGKKFS